LIGLAPLRVFLEAGAYFAPGIRDSTQQITAAIDGLGLQELGEFDPAYRILEYRIQLETQPTRKRN
jgi:glutamate formiminotransferase/formiminotetrahydrofolate cyclodeaminase